MSYYKQLRKEATQCERAIGVGAHNGLGCGRVVYHTRVRWREPESHGGGTTEEGGQKSTFVFNAIQLKDGTVNGHLVYQFRGGDTSFRMDIDCLNIVGNRAVLSGVVTKVSGNPPPYVFVGAPAVFQVVDNGEGGSAPPDLISDVFYQAPDCRNYSPQPYLPISGNIQVQP